MTTNSVPRAARFWNKAAKKYSASPVSDQESYEYKLERTAAYFSPEDRVLEIGCGTGSTALIHAPRVSHIDALDFSEAMIDIAREKAKGVENINFQVSMIEDWAETDYDMVMAHSLLHLLEDLDGTLAKVHSVLKRGGVFVSSTVCIRDLNPLLPLVLPIGGLFGLIPKVLNLTESRLIEHLVKAGFQIEENWRPKKGAAVFLVARKV